MIESCCVSGGAFSHVDAPLNHWYLGISLFAFVSFVLRDLFVALPLPDALHLVPLCASVWLPFVHCLTITRHDRLMVVVVLDEQTDLALGPYDTPMQALAPGRHDLDPFELIPPFPASAWEAYTFPHDLLEWTDQVSRRAQSENEEIARTILKRQSP